MSTEQSESAPQGETQTAPAVDITQQATTPTATTRVKNPKRVAAGKRVSERTQLAREEQKKAAEAYLAENNKTKATPAAPSEPRLQKAKAQSAAEKKK